MNDERQRAEGLLKSLLSVDARLRRAGFHGLSPAWREVYGRWIASGTQTLVLRKGRRAGGTSSACEFIASYLATNIPVPKGDRGVYVFMGQNLARARDNLRRQHEILESLGVEHGYTADRITLSDRPIDLHVYAPNLITSRGILCIGAFLDEAGFIRSDSADEDDVVRAIVEQVLEPAMMTCPGAPLLLVSSPNGLTDYHARRFDEGDSHRQRIAHIPSWVGNPLLTESACRDAAASDEAFRQEYGAEAVDTSTTSAPFKSEWIAALDHSDPGEPVGPRFCFTDPSSGAHDSWVWVCGGWNKRSNGQAVFTFDLADGEFGAWSARGVGSDSVFDKMAEDAKRCGCNEIFTDQRDSNHMTSGARRHGLKLSIMQHRLESKTEAVKRLQLFLEHGQVFVPERNRQRIKLALKNYRQSTSSSGNVKYGGLGKRADDFCAVLLTAMLADQAGLIEGSVNAIRRVRQPPPKAGSPLQSVRQTSYRTSHPIDQLQLDTYGHVITRRRYRSPLEGGGF